MDICVRVWENMSVNNQQQQKIMENEKEKLHNLLQRLKKPRQYHISDL